MKPVAITALLSIFFIGAASCQDSSSQTSSNLPKTKMKEFAADTKGDIPEGAETISLGAGCFWCGESV